MPSKRTMSRTRTALLIATVSWLLWVFLPERARRPLHRVAEPAGRHMRHVHGRLRGAGYHLARHHPDPGVSGTVLADRVRSTLGPLEKRLDMPRAHVMAEGHVVLLHGEVPSRRAARRLERAARRTSGVDAVESHLHVAPIRAAARPSGGRVATH